jgi:SsrA-binding protein
MAKPKDEGEKLVLDNRRARFNYDLGERFEAGMVLLGSEVKTLRKGTGDLTDGWVAIVKGEAWLKGLFLPRLQHAAFGHEERRDRRLLLHDREIYELKKAIEQGGLSVIPLRVYWKNGKAKVELAISKGRKMADKRHAIKERELDREAKSAMARGRRGE